MNWYRQSQSNIAIFRGRSSYNRKSGYYTTDREWARQFTQSGKDSEIISASIPLEKIKRSDPLPEATDPEQIDEAVSVARSEGYAAIWVDEGSGEPQSVLVIDDRVLRKNQTT
jgi:hypothetical protein